MNNINLDINNFNIKELLDIFGLNENYTIEELNRKALEMIQNTNNKNNNNTKLLLIDFIKKSKQKLSDKFFNSKDNSISRPSLSSSLPLDNLDFQNNRTSRINLVGTTFNPTSNHFTYQNQSIINNQINGYGINSYVVNYVFNTQFRDDYFKTVSSNATFTIPAIIKNVIAISLSACQFPNVIYGFNNINQTNTIYIKEDITNLEAIVKIPEGNYTIETLCQTLEDNINLQVCGIPISPTKLNYRFFCTFNLNNYKITISNLFHSFSMNLLRKEDILLDCETFIYRSQTNLDSQPDKECVLPTELFKTMGYIIGFRNFEYSGSTSYTTESTFDNRYTTYVYFSLNEFTSGNQLHTTYGVFPESLSDGKILALIPLSGQNFSTTFDNNANFIYKTRIYNGPIDLHKINIKILNQEGDLVDLGFRDFAFSLQVTCIYDPTVEFVPAAASAGIQ
jgi:hypothetical protein